MAPNKNYLIRLDHAIKKSYYFLFKNILIALYVHFIFSYLDLIFFILGYHFFLYFYIGYVWLTENTKKKNVEENYFFIFGHCMENIKENKYF